MKNKKARRFAKNEGLDKKFEQLHFKPYQYRNQDVCSFCANKLADGAVRFKGIAACANCLERWTIFDENLRTFAAERKVKYESS